MEELTTQAPDYERDETEIRAEIDRTIAEQRDRFVTAVGAFAPARKGARLPLIVNAVFLMVAIIAVLVLWRLFLGTQTAYVLQSATPGGANADIVAALLAEGEAALNETESVIAELQSELSEVEARLDELAAEIARRLESLRMTLEEEGRSEAEIASLIETETIRLEEEFEAERNDLLARRDRLQQRLSEEETRRQSLSAQVNAQRDALETADGASDGQRDDSPLEELRRNEQLRELFSNRIDEGYRVFAQAVGRRDWEDARAELIDLSEFIATRETAGVEGLQGELGLHGQLVPRLEELVLLAEEGFPEDAAADILPGWGDLRGELETAQRLAAEGNVTAAVSRYEAAIAAIPGKTAGMGYLTRQAEQRSIAVLSEAVDGIGADDRDDAESVLRAITVGLSRRDLDVPEPIRALTGRLETALTAVEEQRRELETITNLSEQQLNLLRQSVGAAAEQTGRNPGVTESPETAQMIADEIEALQIRVIESRERQEETLRELDEMRVAYATLEEQLDRVRRRQETLSEPAETLAVLSDRHRNAISTVSSGTGSSAPEMGSLEALVSTFDSAEGSRYFPELSSTIRTLVARIIEEEREVAAAEAEERVLLRVQTATERISEEQLRVLSFSDNTEEDTVELLNTLVREIDTMAATTRSAREGISVPRALGVIVSANNDGTMVIESVGDVDTRAVRRVWVGRLLPDGDRIPIADAEIVAITRDNIVIRIESTIAPSIAPQKNDVVYVEY